MGTKDEVLEMYNFYKNRIKDMKKEEQIEWLEDLKFDINMIDRWQEKDYVCMDAIIKLLKEIKE